MITEMTEEQLERRREQHRRWNKNHPEVVTKAAEKWRRNHPETFLECHRIYHRQWKKDHHEEWRLQVRRKQISDNEETMLCADFAGQRWDESEIDFIREHAITRTAREIAVSLGRTYNAVLIKACLSKIPLQTYDKMHGKLVTT